jgi:hypothetical protein
VLVVLLRGEDRGQVAATSGWRVEPDGATQVLQGEQPEGQTAIPFQEAPAPEAPSEELSLFPFELRPGDLVNVDGREWQVAGHPAVYRQGKMIEVRLRKPGDPSVTDVEHWPAHERVAVKR